jgi:hypothetical protein
MSLMSVPVGIEIFKALNEEQWRNILENTKNKELREIAALEEKLRSLQPQTESPRRQIQPVISPPRIQTKPISPPKPENSPPTRKPSPKAKRTGKRKNSEDDIPSDTDETATAAPTPLSLDSLLDGNIYSLTRDEKSTPKRKAPEKEPEPDSESENEVDESDDEIQVESLRTSLSRMPTDVDIDTARSESVTIDEEPTMNEGKDPEPVDHAEISTEIERTPSPPLRAPSPTQMVNLDAMEDEEKQKDEHVPEIEPTMVVDLGDDSMNLDELDEEDGPLTAPLLPPTSPHEETEKKETENQMSDDDIVSDSDVDMDKSFDLKSPMTSVHVTADDPFDAKPTNTVNIVFDGLSPIRKRKSDEGRDNHEEEIPKADEKEVDQTLIDEDKNHDRTQLSQEEEHVPLTFNEYDSIHETFLNNTPHDKDGEQEENLLKSSDNPPTEEVAEKPIELNKVSQEKSSAEDDIFDKLEPKRDMVTSQQLLDDFDEPITPLPKQRVQVIAPGSPELLVSSQEKTDDEEEPPKSVKDDILSLSTAPISTNPSTAPQSTYASQIKPSQSSLPLHPIDKIGRDNPLLVHSKFSVEGEVSSVSFSPIAQHRLLICTPQEITVRDLIGKEWQEILAYPCNTTGEEFYVARFTPDADMLVVAGRFADVVYSPSLDEDILDNGNIRGSVGSPQKQNRDFNSGIRLYAIDDNNTSMYSEGGNNIGNYSVEFKAHNGRINDFVISEKHSTVISAGQDGSVIKFGLEENWVELTDTHQLETDAERPITSLSFIEDVDSHVVGSSETHIYVWNFVHPTRIVHLPVHQYHIYRNIMCSVRTMNAGAVVFSIMIYSDIPKDDEDVPLSQIEQRNLGLFTIDMKGDNQQVKFMSAYKRPANVTSTPTQSRDSFTAVSSHKTSPYLAAGTQRGKVILFNFKTAQLVGILVDLDGEKITATCMHKCAPLLCVGGENGNLCIYYQSI